ncbi:GIY-YIG nuclease family protein [Sunxiuqinia sp. A32]|uniref:GIY-YIG nuclease family protein n=1 Tax=Sunxiuqinia sp. A32 TaxID=3461496 RepID=UPI00404531BB
MNHFVYIIYSQSVDRFYVGETINVSNRIAKHNSGVYERSSTKIANDWEVFLIIECMSRKQALMLENFIKRMKSRKFYTRLKEDQTMVLSLLKVL